MEFANKKEYLDILWLWLTPYHKYISPEDFIIISSYINSTGIIKVGNDFTKGGVECRRLGFLIQGDLYAHRQMANGDVKTSHFYRFPDNMLITIIKSFDLDIITMESITALSPSVLLFITLADWKKLLKLFPYLHIIKSIAIANELNQVIQDNEDLNGMDDFEWLENLYLLKPYLFFSPFKKHLETYCRFSDRSFDTHFKILKIKYKF